MPLACWQRGADRLQYTTLKTVILSPLPCWADLSAEAYL